MALSVFSRSATTSGISPASPFNYSLVSGGRNSILIITISFNGNPTITGVTYNGVSATLVRADNNGSTDKTAIYYLINPSSGSNTVAVSFTGSPSEIIGGGVCLEDALQSGQPDNSTGGTGSAASPSVNITTGSKCAVIDVVTCLAGDSISSPSSPQVQNYFNTGSFIKGGSSIRFINTADIYNFSWTGTGTYSQTVVSIEPLNLNNFRINILRPRAFSPGIAR